MSALRGLAFFSCAISLFAVTVQAEHARTNDEVTNSSYREIDMPNGWKQIYPGGDTICARGEEFSFFYRAGNQDDVVIDFVGGGACWNFQTCAKETALFVDSVDYLKNRVETEGFNGIYNHSNENNPLKDWSHVVIPYCTGDLHWGDNVETYVKGDKSTTIFHKGAVNAEAVLNWSFSQHHPRRILVTGTSAGGYASIYWLPNIKERAPNASIFQFSDGAAGVVVKEPYQEALKAWNAEQHAPTWIPNLDPQRVSWNELSVVDLYTEVGRHYPTVMLSQFNTNFDAVQMVFYYVMGGQNPDEWSQKALESMNAIDNNITNFQYFFAAGEFHTILPEDLFYSLTVDNVKLVDWLQTMLDQANMGNIVCSECNVTPEIPSHLSNASYAN